MYLRNKIWYQFDKLLVVIGQLCSSDKPSLPILLYNELSVDVYLRHHQLESMLDNSIFTEDELFPIPLPTVLQSDWDALLTLISIKNP